MSRTSTRPVSPPPGPVPFHIGEDAHYSVRWDGAGVDLAAGEVQLSVEPPQYRFVVTAKTAPWVAKFFEAQDRFATTADAMLLPIVHERDQREGLRHVTRAFVYDTSTHRVMIGPTADQARAAGAVTLPLPEGSRDAITALYYARTLPLVNGNTIEIPVNEAGKNLVVELRVGGSERIAVNGHDVDAIRLEPRIRQRVDRRQPVTSTVWLSADARRIPLKVIVVAAFGRITLELTAYHGGIS